MAGEPPAGWRGQWLRVQAAVSEGLCPVHGSPLTPADLGADVIAGYCAGCGAHWYAHRENAALTLPPGTGEMLRRLR